MLLLMRKRIGTIVVKVFAFLLILGFGAWGIQDMLGYQVGGGGAVAEVGDARIGPNELYREVNQEIQRMRPLLGNRLDMETARRLGIIDLVLNRQLDTAATTVTAQSMGIAISDKMVRNEITTQPTFSGLAGNFDHQRFQLILQQAGLSEQGYVEQVRGALASETLLGSVEAGAAPPKSWVDTIYRYREEGRTVDSILISDQATEEPNTPSDLQLREHYEANKSTYTAPEYRSLTYAYLAAAELAKEIAVDEAALRDAYDERAEEFTKEEKRTVRQLIVPDEDKANTAYDRVQQGADFLTVAKEIANLDAAAVELGEISKSDLLPELADPVFNADKGSAVKPHKSALGWHVMQVVDVSEGGSVSFEEVRERLKSDVALEQAIDGLYELSNKFEDSLGGGATIEEAAGDLGLSVEKITAIDAQGRDRAGSVIDGLPGGNAFAATAFATEQSEESGLSDAGDDRFYILRVDNVIKPALRPFEEVRLQVEDAWKAEQRSRQSEQRAKAILDAVNAGTLLAAAAKDTDLTVVTSKPITRDGRGGEGEFTTDLVSDIFKLDVGRAAMRRVEGGYRVAVLKSIAEPDPKADKKGTEELAAALAQSIRGDVASRLRANFRDEAGVKVYQTAIDQLFGATAHN